MRAKFARCRRHEHDRQVFRWVDPEVGAKCAAPIELSRAPRQQGAARLGANGKTKTEAVTLGKYRRGGGGPDVGRKLIASHQLQRLPRQNTPALKDALVREHLGKAQIVHRRRDCTASAAFKLERLAQRVQYALRLAGQRIVGKRQSIAPFLAFRDTETGVDHAKRTPEALLQESAKGFSRDGLNDKAKHVN